MKDTQTALLIIDAQKGFLNENTLHLPSLIENLQFSNLYRIICASQFQNTLSSPFVRWMKWEGLINKKSIELAFNPHDDTKIYIKNTYNAFIPEIESLFEENNINKVHLCGMDTNMCVFHTAAYLFEDGRYEPFVLKNYCGSHSGPEYHESGLKLLEKAIGKSHLI